VVFPTALLHRNSRGSAFDAENLEWWRRQRTHGRSCATLVSIIQRIVFVIFRVTSVIIAALLCVFQGFCGSCPAHSAQAGFGICKFGLSTIISTLLAERRRPTPESSIGTLAQSALS
jgi:hypothetical protein